MIRVGPNAQLRVVTTPPADPNAPTLRELEGGITLPVDLAWPTPCPGTCNRRQPVTWAECRNGRIIIHTCHEGHQ